MASNLLTQLNIFIGSGGLTKMINNESGSASMDLNPINTLFGDIFQILQILITGIAVVVVIIQLFSLRNMGDATQAMNTKQKLILSICGLLILVNAQRIFVLFTDVFLNLI